ncbi:MAG: flavodoxin domain-containing protein [Candidatus Hodarchaeales archaeon]
MENKKKVLIAYGSRFGSSEGVAGELAKILEEEGLTTTVIDLRKKKQDFHLDQFDGIIVGSGIKIGKWTKEAKTFLSKIKGVDKTIGVYICSVEVKIPQKSTEARKKYLENPIEESGTEVHISEAFGGLIDFTKESRMGFLDKKLMKAVGSEIDKENILKLNKETVNDFRDWDRVRSFARKYAVLMRSNHSL